MTFSYVAFGQTADAEALLEAPSPLDSFPGYGEKVLDPGRWATLARLLGFDPTAALEMRGASPLAAGDPEDEPWVYEVPPTLLERLGSLDAERCSSIARAWFDADQFVAMGGLEYANDVLSRLVAASRRAAADNVHVLVLVEL